MSDFFKNDFNEDRWRKAALKNAFDLLGRQRFEHAAAFFLLADHLEDAIEVRMQSKKKIGAFWLTSGVISPHTHMIFAAAK